MKLFQKLTKVLNKYKLKQTKLVLNGKEINLTSDNMIIKSNNFNVDKNGNMTCTNANVTGTIKSTNATITGGKINIFGEGSATDLIRTTNSNNSSEYSYIQPVGASFVGNSGRIDVMASGSRSDSSFMDFTDDNGYTNIQASGIRTPQLIQTSKESKKKNITKYNEKALDIVKDSEIYTYNFKGENDKNKKHIGFVIGDKGGNYKTPEQVISNDREGIENYSMTSILWKAFQEYITEKDKQIEQLQNKIIELEGKING